LIPRQALYAFSHVPNIKAIGLHIQVLWQFFASVQKEGKKREIKSMKLNEFLQACISGMVGEIFFKFGM